MNKKLGQASIKIVVSLLLFGFIFYQVDVVSVVKNLSLLNIWYIPLLVLLLVTNYVVSAYRWKTLLIHKNSDKVGVSYLTSLYFIGSFFNNFMPTSVGGDVFKIYSLGKKIKSNADAFTATFMERFTGVIALVLISYYGLVQTLDFLLLQLPSSITDSRTLTLLFEGALFFGFWVGTLVAFMSLKFFAKKVKVIKKVYDSLLVYKMHRGVLVSAFLTSFIVQLLAIFTQFFIFKGMGIEIPLNYALFVFPVITLVSFFVPSLNGLGVQDALYIQLFLSVGVSSEIALSASIIYHLMRLFVSLFGGVLYALGKQE